MLLGCVSTYVCLMCGYVFNMCLILDFFPCLLKNNPPFWGPFSMSSPVPAQAGRWEGMRPGVLWSWCCYCSPAGWAESVLFTTFLTAQILTTTSSLVGAPQSSGNPKSCGMICKEPLWPWAPHVTLVHSLSETLNDVSVVLWVSWCSIFE